MRLDERLSPEILRSEINWVISAALIASFSFGAGLILWNAAFGHNPIADTLTSVLYAQAQELQ